jgi:hypothetical protein
MLPQYRKATADTFSCSRITGPLKNFEAPVVVALLRARWD